ncbi:copper homeostasis protein CutC [Halanaerobium sp. ST460_2HS_T2]|jgi:copper homeostasis protein|uniref:copper homeostasis protein CutC n=1 Tax=Halanaerobium sp. ST460_2HS_T2 TaxID=2183914 RepID=UPI000DF129EF|nr:copper homeostasis protein CutC [Halanaerobium sp. ST460_2HS_T2]RCW58672.1 copper homeostasis protein [Halanaerobium sp. ST460_2HS_T2]
MIKLEICCASAADAVNAFKGGADRVELNSAIAYGGLTPSLADLEMVKAKTNIPVMVMIRPRSGGFSYSEMEFEVMKREAELAVESGADGLVFGVLKENRELDLKRNKILRDIAGDKITVFHRAFDIVPAPFAALDKIKEIGMDRVLTSAQANKVADNLQLAKEIIAYAGEELEILLGGGIREHNLKEIIEQTNCREVHLSAFNKKVDKSMLKQKLKFNSDCISESEYKLTDIQKVKRVKEILSHY